MRNRFRIKLILAGLGLLAWSATVLPAHAAVAKRKAGTGRAAQQARTPSERAGIPPEAFGSPVPSPDHTRWAWIADEGDGPNLYVGNSDRSQKTLVSRYRFSRVNDLMPGIPILWSPDGKYVAYYEYSHSAQHPTTSSRAVIVAADGGADPLRVTAPGADLNTRPVRWLSERTLRFKGLRLADVTAPEDPFVFDLATRMAQTESDYLAARAALGRTGPDSAAAATGAQNPPAPASGSTGSH